MEKWNKPQIVDLDAQYTEGGGGGVQGDGVMYDFFGYKVIGTSGPALPNPPFVPVGPA